METTYLRSKAISSALNMKKKFIIPLMYFLSYRTLKMTQQKKANR